MSLNIPLKSNVEGRPLRVAVPGRISKPTQDRDSISSQHEDVDSWLQRVVQGPFEAHHYGEQESGWVPDRDSMVLVEELVEAGEVDVVVALELREIYRNPSFHWRFVQKCIDNNVRVILINNNVDTADPNWEVAMHTASMLTGMERPVVRQRVQRKAKYSFKYGGMVGKIKYGYRKLSREEAKSGNFGPVGLRVAKLPECTQTIRKICDHFRADNSYAWIADWLNDEGIDPGPYVEGGKWTPRLVRELLSDLILSGKRRFRVTVNRMLYETGKPRREPNSEKPDMNEYPCLAHISVEEHEEILRLIAERKRQSAAGQKKGKDSPNWNRPRSRSLWPGQHARCRVCGGLMYRYGAVLRCRNTVPAGTRECWNHLNIDYEYVFDKVLGWTIGVLAELPDMEAKLIEAARVEYDRTLHRKNRSVRAIDHRITQVEKEIANLQKAIRLGGPLESLVAELTLLDTALTDARAERKRLEAPEHAIDQFPRDDEVRRRLPEILRHLAATSLDFADLMRRLLPEFVIFPVQALDSTAIKARAKLTLRLDEWQSQDEPRFERSITLDLFDPPDHIEHMAACAEVAAREPNLTLMEIGEKLGINRMTVKRARDYWKRMKTMGVTDPYRELLEKPEKGGRWRD